MKSIVDPSKITPPEPTGLLDRPRLIERIKRNEAKRLTLIIAQAAQGKSSLAASYVKAAHRPCAWVNLDPVDSDPVNLFLAITSSLQQSVKSTDFSSLLSYPSVSMGPKEPALLFRDWSTAILDHITVPTLLLLDGLDQLPSDSPSFQFLSSFVEHLHPPLHLLVLSREVPPFRLEELRVKQDAFLLTNRDLAFNMDETRSFFLALRGIELSPRALQRIHTTTGGWIGGLVLISHALEAIDPAMREAFVLHSIPSVFKGHVFDYFTEEVFSSQPEFLKDFLIKSSIFDPVDPQIVDSLLDTNNSLQILEQCAKKNLFVQPGFGGKQGRIYRYHPLFRDFLNLKLNTDLSEDSKRQLLLKAGSACKAVGEAEEAIKFYLKARAYEEAALLIQDLGMQLINMGRTSVLSQWLNEFPKPLIKKNPWLLLYLSMTRRFTQASKNLISLRSALDLFEKEENISGQLLCIALLMEGIMMMGRDTGLMDELLKKAEKHIEQLPPDSYLFEKAMVLVQMPYGYIPRFADQRRALWASQKAYIISKQLGILPLEFIALLQIAMCHAFLGQFPKAREFYSNLEALVAKCPYPEFKALRHLHYSHLCLWSGQLEKTRENIERASTLASEHGLLYLYPIAVLYEVALGFCLENHNIASKAASRLIEFSRSIGNVFLETCGILFLGISHYRVGEYEKAKEIVEKALETFSSHEVRSAEHYREGIIALGFIGYHLGPPGKYIPMVEDSLRHYQEQGNDYFSAQAHFALALLNTKRSQASAASDHIARGFSLSQKNKYEFFIYCSKRDLIKVCLWAIKLGVDEAINYASYLLSKGLRPEVTRELKKLTRHASPKVRAKAKEILTQIHRANLPHIYIQTLGQFQTSRANEVLSDRDWKGSQPQNLLKAIIARGAHGVQKDMLCDDLWPQSSPASVDKTFKVALHRLRTSLEPNADRTIGSCYVHLKDNKVSLDPELCHVDAKEFEDLISQGKMAENDGRSKEALDLYTKAIELYKGDFLPQDIYSLWAEAKREELKSKYIETMLRVAHIHETRGALKKAISYYLKIIDNEPLFEEAYQRLMVLYSSRGEKAQAIRIYERCKDALRRGLDTEPSQTTVAIYRRIAG